MMASAVSRMRRKIVGRRRGIAVNPMIERSSMANGLGIPAAAMARPPTPANLIARPSRRAQRIRQRRRRARHRIPRRRRYRSTEARAEAWACGELRRPGCRLRLRNVVHRPPPSPTPTRKTLARSAAAMTSAISAMIELPAATANPAKARARDILDGLPADRRQIEAAILTGLWCFHQDASAARARHPLLLAQFGYAPEHIVGPFRRLDRKHIVVGDDHRLTHIKRPQCRDHFQRKGNILVVALPPAGSVRARPEEQGSPARHHRAQ